MYKTTHRALRATVAAAGMAALGMSFVGTAAAATPNAQDETTDANSLLGSTNSTNQQAPAAPDLSNGTPSPGVYNDLFTFEVPTVQTASYHTSSPSNPVLVSDVDEEDEDSYDPNNDDEDNVCHGTGGSFYDPLNHNAYQHPCQSSGNSFYDGIGLPVANPVAAKGMNYSLLHDSSTEASDEDSDEPTSTSSSLAGLAPASGLNQMNHLTQV
ncbi:MAG TPA: hypothetical protein VK735_10205 [Pseudonocardia sp.]|jgi:hypothetical protein|uniref:hypothetical protein n=1 Tax=Pseudonocardia sp. TaxID=60912 RepID=UPI002C20DA88|nr:hypothetical protein [Pseudonocardia sp.]HTF47810.1 hypothetical protein [Pseudonocardia sp.]